MVSSSESLVAFYKQLGFFNRVDAKTVVERFVDERGDEPDLDNPWHDVFLLRLSDGVWSGDPERDVCAENAVYEDLISQFADISKGSFAAESITESWDTDTGPIKVSFQLKGKPVSISPKYRNDWFDLDVLKQINALISPSGRQFECAADGNFALVLCLTPDVKQRMENERNFPFAW